MGQARGRPVGGPGGRHPAGGGSDAATGEGARRGEKAVGHVNELLTEDRGAIRILTLNRPEKRNALNTALTRALLEGLRAADAAESVGCVVLTGAGQGFCAGADLSEFKDLKDPQAAAARAELTMQLHLVFSKITKPVI